MTILTQTFPPAPGGMNVAMAAQEIDDTEAAYLQDVLLDYPGLARERGPVQISSAISALSRRGSGLVTTIDPSGTSRFAALTGTAANGYLTVWNASLSATTDIAWPYALPTDPVGSSSTAYRLVSQNPALGGGNWIGTASNYGAGSNQALGLWRGGYFADYTTGTISFTRGATGVTGVGTSWLTTVSPGMFLFANTDDASAGTFTQAFIGVVQTVNSNTSITLAQVAPYSGSAGRSYTLTALRGFIPKISKGRITTDTSSTTVSGGATKFGGQGLGTGVWNIYRSRDLTWVGKVSTVQSDISLTLAANAAVAMADESYIAIRGDWSTAEKSVDIGGATNKVGWVTAIYAERQWYANNAIDFTKTYRLHFSSTGDLESVDMTDDGDWIPISSTTDSPEPIRALCPTYNALVVIKDTETFAVYGNSPTSFSSKKLEDDGTISTMSVQSYGGGAIWAGRNGLYYYDGVQVNNLTAQKFGNVWKNTIRTFDPLRYRAWSMVVRNHYFLFFEKLVPTINPVKGTTAVTPDHWTVVVNMDTQAFSILKNVGIRGAVQLPAEQGRGTWALVNDETAGVGKVIDTADLFDSENVDSFITTPSGALGPDWYVETKKFNAGEDIRLKRFKLFAAHYMIQNTGMKIDTVLGLNNVGSTLSTIFPASVLTWDQLRVLIPTWSGVSGSYGTWNALIQGVFQPKRARFLKKAHHISFRLYKQSSSGIRAKIGPYQIGFKVMRPGRV
ncbi:MAG: hypothetical protein LC118_08035 [Dehalococcoidia bacterium]|nr:hypothetical protein [Dehalococcoidia bacterium]